MSYLDAMCKALAEAAAVRRSIERGLADRREGRVRLWSEIRKELGL